MAGWDAYLIRLLLRLFFFLLPIVLLGMPLFLLLSAVQPTALVERSSSMSHRDVDRIQNLFRQHDPRGMHNGELRYLAVTSRDMNLALNYALRRSEGNRGSIEVEQQSATLRYSYALPDNPLGQYLNVSVALEQRDPRLSIRHLEFGRIRLPGRWINPLMHALDTYLRGRSLEYREVLAAVKSIELTPGELQMVYQWHSGLANQLQGRGRDLLLPPDDRRRIEAYYIEISARSRELTGDAVFTDLLGHLFTLAHLQTQNGNDARSEHRALFLALGLAVSGRSFDKLMGHQVNSSRVMPAAMDLTLAGRGDLAQHFALSAAISAAGGGGLADAVGIFKELNDSRGGSGFSFVDLLADRAGVELARRAMGAGAEKIQQRMLGGLKESDYMPAINNLPEGLLELQFKSRYQDLDSHSYSIVNEEIERRIGACRVYL